MKSLPLIPILLFFISSSCLAQNPNQAIFDGYNMLKVHESTLGIYYAQANEQAQIEKIDSFLISKADSISTRFKHRLTGKVQFEFYPNQALAEFVCGWDTTKSNQKSNRIGCAHYINKIQMVMPGATPKSDSIYSDWGGDLKVILHEYIHSFTYDIVGEDRINKIPFLFTEGIALYTSKQIYLNSNFKKIIHQRLEQNAVPKFQILMINKKFITIKNSYHWSFLFINYIIDNYGWDTFLDIQNNFEDYNKILKKKDKEINQDWFQYLESNRLKI